MIEKSDFVVGGRLSRTRRGNDPYGLRFSSPVKYTYRTPIGKDEEGNLIYSPYDKVVSDQEWIYPGSIYQNETGRRNFSREEYREMQANPETTGMDLYRRGQEAKELDSIEQIMDTASHEAGHSAHAIVDNLNDRVWQGRKNQAGMELFDEDAYRDSLSEAIAYRSEYPFRLTRWFQGMDGHPDVKERYMNKIVAQHEDINPELGGTSSQTKRNLINAVLDMTSRAGRMAGTGHFQFGDLDKPMKRKKQAERSARKLIRQIQALPNEGISGFSDLPQDLQEQLGRVQLREALTQFMQDNHQASDQETFDFGDGTRGGNGAIEFMRKNPDKFFENYVRGKEDWDWDDYGNIELNPDAAYGFVPNSVAEWSPEPDLTDEEINRLREAFGSDDRENAGWYVQAKAKSNPYTRTMREYSRPRFGSDAILQDIIRAYQKAESMNRPLDSSRAFMKSWEMMR
jgi:hypothetical protein